MNNISGRNVHEVFANACWLLTTAGLHEETRVGPVLCLPGPVLARYQRPRERVLLWPERKANPYFHLFEALWMLSGSNELNYIEQFNPRMREFSDDNQILHGAYGYRWRVHFGQDQLTNCIDLLNANPETRRAVISMWDPESDLGDPSKDLPCNTHIYFRRVNDKLDMTVCNRSNDVVWGMCGSNVVHFSILHEFMAHATGNVMGSYYHFTNNLHIYDGISKREIYSRPFIQDYYSLPSGQGGVEARNMFVIDWHAWLRDCTSFVHADRPDLLKYRDPFFETVAVPMWKSWNSQDSTPLKLCLAEDWRRAGELYFEGRTVV